ncbi:hypothetical protein BKA93DRAFT_740539 [Sparassis latifolia]
MDRIYYEYLRQSIEEERVVEDHHAPHRRVVPLPDLRFEQSYLRLVAPYVRVERKSAEEPLRDRKGKGKAVEGWHVEDEVAGSTDAPSSPGEVIHIQWGPVIWYTAREQIIGPFIWYVLASGIMGYFYWPIASSFRTRIGSWWSRGTSRTTGTPKIDGYGVNWLRNWIASLISGTKNSTHHVGLSQ